jgi:hypothetical protein
VRVWPSAVDGAGGRWVAGRGVPAGLRPPRLNRAPRTTGQAGDRPPSAI